MQDTELIIKRYIRKQLSKLKPRDKDSVIKYLNEQIDSTYDEALEEFYKRHMVGFDVFKILEEDSFYEDVPYFKLPNHIKVKPSISYPKKLVEEIDSQFYEFNILNRGNVFASPSHIIDFEAQRNYLKRIFNKIVKRYITGKTYKSWVNKNASKLSLDELFDIKAEIEKTNIFQTSEPIENEEIIDKEIDYFKGKTNQFNKAPLALVVNYFMQLAEVPDEPFLSREDVLKFIDKAFCGNNEIELLTLVNFKNKKGFIYKLFHNFYEECPEHIYELTNYGKKGDYVKLLTSNFANFEYSTVFGNFSNSDFKPWKKFKELK